MSSLLDQYLMDQRGTLAPDTIRHYGWILRKLELPLTLEQAREYKARRLDEVTPATVCCELRAVKSFDAWYAAEFDQEPLLARLKFPRVKENPEAPIASEDDLAALLGTCDDSLLGLRDAALISLLWCSGIRRRECAELLVSDVDLALGQVLVREAKNGQSRTAFVSREAQKRIRRYLRAREAAGLKSDRLWIGKRGPATVSLITCMLRKRSATAGIAVTAHQFRRGVADRWLREGGSETLLRANQGWRSPTMVGRYVRRSASELAMIEAKRLFEK